MAAQSTDRCPQPVGRITSAQGLVELRGTTASVWNVSTLNSLLCPGDSIRVGRRSRADLLLFATDAVLRIDQLTTLQIVDPAPSGPSLLDLIRGAIHFFSRLPQALEVRTPFVSAGVEGTEFVLRVEQDRTLVSVFEGLVRLRNDQGALLLAANQSGEALAGQAPQLRLVARPRDGVQWALYYQPLSTASIDPSAPALRESLEALRGGNLTQAFERLEEVSESDRNEAYYVYRAGLLLSVGRVDEASLDLDQALRVAPQSGGAYGLRAVIEVARNDPEQALADGHEAVRRSPRSSFAKIALSYAQQASFELEAARDTLLQAVDDQPQDNLAWARLAELWLSLGDLDRALEAAERATSLGPELGRTQTVLGFARLTQTKIADARAAFERALGLESESPLIRLGLGLAKIRDGELREGRRDIEIAVSLDPNNALIRSYLGKAYFEEKRDAVAEEQLNLAKQLDPNDPTPYFYDAIRKQTINRPVAALHDLQRSIELNDNRAVYRSRLLLDEDLAARSASLARIYRDLGFEQVALVEGWKSVVSDPSDYSGHRFLADTYSVLPRHEIARVSELLQSQLLQPINITPVQPSLAETDLLISESSGPTGSAFNEFTPLFHRNRFALQASGVLGGNDTFGDEVVHSGVWNRFAYSIGQFHLETDGFRENNNQDQDIYDLFLQASLTHKTSIQGEFRSRTLVKGDLPLLFDSDSFLPFLAQSEEFDTARFGLHHAFAPGSDLIASVIYGRFDGKLDDQTFDPFFQLPGTVEIALDDDAWTVEIQHLYRSRRFRITSGGGYFQADRKDVFTVRQSVPFPPGLLEFSAAAETDVRQINLYLYSLIDYPQNVTFTLGASADFFDDGDSEINQFNPKLGVTWNPVPSTTLRGAVFRTLQRALVSSQTIEPTNVAGFNQLFFAREGEEAWRYGLGLDHKFSSSLYGGGEFSWRDLEVPFTPLPPAPPAIQRVDWEERLGRAYLYWAPHDLAAFSAEYLFERFDRDEGFGIEQIDQLDTHRLRLGIRHFHPSGFSARFNASYVSQKGEFGQFEVFPTIPGEDRFWVFDAALGYRLPERHGLITLEARNLFDGEFQFQDSDPGSPAILPERLILLRFTVSF